MKDLLTSREMRKTDAKTGYWWVNVAPLGEPPLWRQEVTPHESGLLFGYEPTELMAKQYERANGHSICVQPLMARDRCGMRATHVTPNGKYVCATHAREIAIVFYSSGGSLEPCKLTKNPGEVCGGE